MPDPGQAATLTAMNALAMAGISTGSAAIALGGKIIFDWLKTGRQQNNPASNLEKSVPHAKNGFLTLAEIETHCTRQQATCQKVFKAEFTAFQEIIDARLDRGDKQFDVIETRLGEISKQITATQAGNGKG